MCSGIGILNKTLIYISHPGLPRTITANNSHEFKNSLVQDFWKTHSIEWHYTSLYVPCSNNSVAKFDLILVELILSSNGKNHENVLYLLEVFVMT